MLGELLERTLKHIAEVNREGNVELFAAQLVQSRPEYEEETALRLARSALLIVLETPEIARHMWELLQGDSCTLEQRCALAVTLAYLVQPVDLQPESFPAGFGYVDDALLLRYAMLCELNRLPPQISDEETEKSRLSILAACVSAEAREPLKQEMARISRRVRIFSQLPRPELEHLLDRVMKDPLGALDHPLPDEEGDTPERWDPFNGSVVAPRRRTGKIVDCLSGPLLPGKEQSEEGAP